MKKTPVRKSILLTLIVLLFSVLLTGCIEIVPPPPTDTGTVKIEVTGNYVYDIYMDGDIEFEDKIPGTYTLYNVPEGNHEFKAVDVMGASFGEDKDTIYVNAGQINYVYLSPASITPEPTTGSLKVVIMDDPGWEYEVYLGNQDTGEYLGNTSGSSIVGQNSATILLPEVFPRYSPVS